MRSTFSLLAGVLLIAFCLVGKASARNLNIIAFGDSITQGWKSSNPSQNLEDIYGITWPPYGERTEDGYEPELENLFEAQTEHNAFVYNWGHQGENTFQGLNRIDQVISLDSTHNGRFADFILIMEGANDHWNLIPHAATISHLGEMIRKSKDMGITPVIATVTPLPGVDYANINDQIKNTLARNYGIKVADQYEALIGNWETSHSGDGIHLNDEGERVMAQTWLNAILESEMPPTQAPIGQVIVSTRGLQRLLELDPSGQCTKAEEIQITVPGPGTVVVTAHSMFGLKSHTQGRNDIGMMFIDDHERECDYSCWQGCPMGFSIAADVPSWTASHAKLIPVSLSRTFHVGEAGEYKYYLNGRNVALHGSLKVWSTTLNAVFYPD